MKLNHLALAVILASSGTLLSCSDDTKKPENKKEATPKTLVVEQVKMNAEELANTAETRYKGLIELNNHIFAQILTGRANSPWKDAKAVIDSYTREENGAVAKETVTLTPTARNPIINTPLIVSSDDKITYNQELLAQGIVAQIQHHIDATGIVSNIESEQLRQSIENTFKNLNITTDILTNDNAKTNYDLKAFTIPVKNSNDETATVSIGGMKGFYQINEKDVISNLGAGEGELTIEPIVLRPDNEPGSLTLQGFKITRSLSASGDFKATASPIKVDFTAPDEDDFSFEIQGFEQTGTNITFDPLLGTYIGKSTGKLGDLFLSEKGEPAINYGNLTFTEDSSKNAQGNYDLGGSLTINFNGEELQKRAELPIQPVKSNFAINLTSLSPETLEAVNYLAQLTQLTENDDAEEMQSKVAEGLTRLSSSLKENNTQIQLDIAQDTKEGNVTIAATFKPREGDQSSATDWQTVLTQANQNPMILAMLLQQSIDFTIDVKISASLLAAIGQSEMVEAQGGGMVKKEGDNYVIHIENTSNGLFVNGQQMM